MCRRGDNQALPVLLGGKYIKKKPGMEISESPNTQVSPASEATAQGTNENSDRAFADVISTPFESKDNQPGTAHESLIESASTPEVREDEIVRLLEERLLVDRSKRKVGDIIVRKEIETRMVQVPVRREKLIVEQVSPERKQLAEIDLGQGEITGIELTETASLNPQIAGLDDQAIVMGEFNSPKIASLLLNAIALERRQGCKKVRVEIVVEDAELQKTYQEWFDRCSGKKGSGTE